MRFQRLETSNAVSKCLGLGITASLRYIAPKVPKLAVTSKLSLFVEFGFLPRLCLFLHLEESLVLRIIFIVFLSYSG